jgi:MerR family transcriptional regulator/heat shock protein HspR
MYDREPLYVISVAARLLGMHAQTLRKYEREHFIVPSRTKGRLRLYSAEDIERLRQIKYLVEERGLNLAGVELALTLAARLRALPEAMRGSGTREEATERVERELDDLLALLGATPDARRPGGRGEGNANGAPRN